MRTVTISFEDGGSHVYQNVPDEVTPDQVEQRAGADFSGRRVVSINGGRSAVDQIPGNEPGKPVPALPAQDAPEPTLADTAIGTGEAALTTVTGIAGGTLGMLGGTLKGLAEQILAGKFGTPEAAQLVEQSAMEGAQALTYEPRTESGREQAAVAGEALQNLIPIAPVAAALMPAGAMPRGTPGRVVARAGTEGVARAVGGDVAAAGASRAIDAASRVADMATKGATTLPRRALEALRREQRPTPGTMGSVGSAGTDVATQRRAMAENLPVPIKLTKGQATRDPAQLTFEREAAKQETTGAPLRTRHDEQNQQLLQNIDVMFDKTGAEAPTLRVVGAAVDKALVQQAAKDKAAYRVAYKNAEKAGAMEDPVTLGGAIEHLNESMPDVDVAPLLSAARKRALRYGVAVEGPDGDLIPQQVTLNVAERYRQSINDAVDFQPQNVRHATILKGLIDETTDGLGGDAYRYARGLRARYAQNYENRSVISKLLSTKKGTSDRQVAFEDIFNHSVLKGSLDDVRNVRRVLQRSGPEGQQAWRELQGATLRHLREEATQSAAKDAAGNAPVSADKLVKAVRALDSDGKLDFVFGKQGAQQVRDLADIASEVLTLPRSAWVNTSNTAVNSRALLADMLLMGPFGAPVPVISGYRLALQHIKDVKLRRRISEALDEIQKKQAPGKPRPPMKAPNGDTVH